MRYGWIVGILFLVSSIHAQDPMGQDGSNNPSSTIGITANSKLPTLKKPNKLPPLILNSQNKASSNNLSSVQTTKSTKNSNPTGSDIAPVALNYPANTESTANGSNGTSKANNEAIAEDYPVSPNPKIHKTDYIPQAEDIPFENSTTLGDGENNPQERFNWGMKDDPYFNTGKEKKQVLVKSPKWWTSFRKSLFGSEDAASILPNFSSCFESDHEMDSFISPVSNPFLAEDPRKLTEIRPIFMLQTIPSSQYFYRGGNLEFFGLQGRIGLTERFSVVFNKLGLTVVNPGGSSGLGNSTSFDELWFGPKYTFYRDPQSGTVAAGGLTFQIPLGSSAFYQNTGTFGLVPYASIAQKFGQTSWGEFQVLDSGGYSMGFGTGRSDYIYNTLHLDYDVGNWHRFFPLLELNWYYYTRNGTANPNLAFEALDLANVGAPLSGKNYLNLAAGARFRFTQNVDLGLAAQFPLNTPYDLMGFRFTMDLIWRF